MQPREHTFKQTGTHNDRKNKIIVVIFEIQLKIFKPEWPQKWSSKGTRLIERMKEETLSLKQNFLKENQCGKITEKKNETLVKDKYRSLLDLISVAHLLDLLYSGSLIFIYLFPSLLDEVFISWKLFKWSDVNFYVKDAFSLTKYDIFM